MARITNEGLSEISTRLAQRAGSVPTEVGPGGLTTQPSGTPVPTTPGRVPTRRVPASRALPSFVEPALDLACFLHNRAPNTFLDRARNFGENPVSRAVRTGLLNAICDNPPGRPPEPSQPRPPVPSSPFSGGQCECARYRITLRIRDGSTNSDVTRTEQNLRGPIRAIQAVTLTNAAGSPTATRGQVVHGSDACGGERTTIFSPGVPSQDGAGTVTVVEIVNQDGPDSCGDPPPDFSPDNESYPLNPTIDIDPGDGGAPINITPEFGFDIGPQGPQLVIDIGDVNIGVDLGGVDINFEQAPPTGGGGGGGVCEPESPDLFEPDPSDTREPPPPEVPPDDPATDNERIIRAVIVTAGNIATPATPIVPSNGAPIVYAPRLGTLQFKIRASTGGSSGWTEDIDIKNAQQYIEVPAPQGAVDVEVFPFGATTFNIERIYSTLENV